VGKVGKAGVGADCGDAAGGSGDEGLADGERMGSLMGIDALVIGVDLDGRKSFLKGFFIVKALIASWI
jgi:hypothetical protein